MYFPPPLTLGARSRKRYLIMKFMNNRNINNDIKLDIIKYLEY